MANKEEIIIGINIDKGDGEKQIDALTKKINDLTKANKDLAAQNKELAKAGQENSKFYITEPPAAAPTNQHIEPAGAPPA